VERRAATTVGAAEPRQRGALSARAHARTHTRTHAHTQFAAADFRSRAPVQVGGCLCLAGGYVASLYLWRGATVASRDDPATIKKRMLSVGAGAGCPARGLCCCGRAPATARATLIAACPCPRSLHAGARLCRRVHQLVPRLL